VDYLWQYSSDEWGLDRSLDGLEKADKIAYAKMRMLPIVSE
jgi:hypothetical protein